MIHSQKGALRVYHIKSDLYLVDDQDAHDSGQAM